MKTFFRRIHLYLGLVAGLIIMITCFTGAALVFEKEWQTLIYPERYKVEEKGTQASIAALFSALKQKVPQANITSVKFYNNPGRSVEITYSEEKAREGKSDKKEDAKSDNHKSIKEVKPQAGKGPSNTQAFMNPYSGELISLYSHRNSFFYTMFSLHRWLLAGDIGKLIVGISTLIFLFILTTGIILWWPENKKKLKQRLKLKWNAGWKRINHDLHIVLGFYTAIFLFVIAFTGLAWSFQWFNDGIYWITGTENKRPEPPTSIYQHNTPRLTVDEVNNVVKKSLVDIQYYTINLPKDSVAAYSVTALSMDPAHEKATDQYFYDQYSGTLVSTALYSERNLGQRIRSTFYPVHVGSIAGLPGRIIAFVVCLSGAMFPITGIILWINRLSKEKRKARKSFKAQAALRGAINTPGKIIQQAHRN